MKKLKLNWAYLAMVLGALLNITVQLSSFVDKGELLRRFDITFSEFIRQWRPLMLRGPPLMREIRAYQRGPAPIPTSSGNFPDLFGVA